MTTENPLISIYMPTWNRQQLAIRAIKSVLRQDYPHWEMIIVDDCSSSYEQLQQFVEELNDPRVSYTHNSTNSGACAVRNQAIMQASGQLFDTTLKAAQDYDIFLRMVVAYGKPWKVKEATQILHVNHGEMRITSSPNKFSGYFQFYRKHKGKFDRASKKYQLFTLYQIRNKRMNWRTLLTLLSVRNSKRLADGLRGR